MIKVEINDPEVAANLERLVAKIADLKPAFKEIGEYLVLSTKRRFSAGTAPDGSTWPANTESTILAFLRRKAGSSVRREGETAASPKTGMGMVTGKRPLIGESKRLSNEFISRADSQRLIIGSGEKQAAVMQFGARRGSFGSTRRGGPIPWGDIPARPFLGISAEDSRAISEIVNEYLTAGR